MGHNHRTDLWAKQAQDLNAPQSDDGFIGQEQEENERDAFLRQLAPSDPSRRAVFMLRPGFPLYQGDTITRGKTRLTVKDGVPPDATLIQVYSDPLNYGLCLHAIFEHPSFEPISEGSLYPSKIVSYSMETMNNAPLAHPE